MQYTQYTVKKMHKCFYGKKIFLYYSITSLKQMTGHDNWFATAIYHQHFWEKNNHSNINCVS